MTYSEKIYISLLVILLFPDFKVLDGKQMKRIFSNKNRVIQCCDLGHMNTNIIEL